MTTTQAAAPWWRTAPNPPCEPWCTSDHDPGEFSVGGGMTCLTDIAAPDAPFTVELQSYVGLTETDDGYDAEAPNVDLTIEAPDDFLDPDQCEALAATLLEAARTLRDTKPRPGIPRRTPRSSR